ncbi:CoA transferase subunit A [Geoglobus acetivorans]|uniref:Glutaconate CoA-transferase subunit A n=1 Tax=Geoglobus acetivorans TaxID=565033 RepID=A0ABZ3H789_GEOAI|nr:CoA transferase subunit A [Geoglobus acetivorans]
MSKSDKVMGLEEAVRKFVRNGNHIAFGGFTLNRMPVALIYEIIRQGVKDLHVYGHSPGFGVDVLIGSGSVKAIELAYEADEGFGRVGPRFRKAVERRETMWEDYSNFGMTLRFLAGAMGISFLPTKTMLGSDMLSKEGFSREFRESDPKIASKKLDVIECPFTGEKVVALPAVNPDVAVIHAQVADADGNVRIYGQAFADDIIAKSADRVIVTCEKLVDSEELRKFPEQNVLPGFLVDAVVPVEFGAHPTSCARFYDYDPEFLRIYHSLAKDDGSFTDFLEKYVLGVEDHDEYLRKVGIDRLESLRASFEVGYNPGLKRV